ncbi:MAG: uracil-xanthine permease, partial [Firmicutes bacterium]|nr:uracil-xanthine permease [Bacillota bacterium]
MGKTQNQTAIYDARKELGHGKVAILGLQHMFAMFGATVLVPIITGLSVSTTLLFAGLATLFMHVVTNFKVPVFLGSSFAFLGGYAAVKAAGVAMGYSDRVSLNYA